MQSHLDGITGIPNLYIGGLFSLRRKDALKDADITHVVSAIRLPLDESLFAPYKHHVVEIDDVDDDNILEHFVASNAFIQEGLDGGGGVLVHCAMGKSRSTTLIIAYILFTHSLHTPTSALTLIQKTRPFAEPNSGFMAQLELYHRMHCPTDIDSQPLYQRWLYQRTVEASIACGQAPEADVIRFSDEAAAIPHEQSEDGEKVKQEYELRCRRCRRSLATSQYLIPHTPKPSSSAAANTNSTTSVTTPISTLTPASNSPPTPCAHYFLDPLSWMRPALSQGLVDGRLECPNQKCRTNVGKYAWQGMQCSCGEWVVPGISLARGKVDEVPRKTQELRMPPGLGKASGGNL